MEGGVIGVFDSGVGGLTVLKAIRDLLPEEELVYFGDTARVPYGTKSPKTIVKYSLENARLLSSFNLKMLVVACNTSSAHALEVLKKEFPIPVVGVVEPGAKLAVSSSKKKQVGVIGTEATVKSNAYKRAILSLDSSCEVYQKACPLLVPLIEEGWLDDPITAQVLKRYLSHFEELGIDTLVLGCTHYPLVKGLIGKLYPQFKLIDSAQAVALTVKEVLGSRSSKKGRGSVKVLVSDKTDRFERIAKMIMGSEISVEEVNFDKE